MDRSNEMAFLAKLTKATVDACRVGPGDLASDGQINAFPYAVIRPGGRLCYPAVWVQDFTMVFSSGFVSDQEGLNHLRLFMDCQNGEQPRTLQSGAYIPAYAIPDHVRMDGQPVFYPGTYSAGEDQGGEPWGIAPPFNNHYDVVWLAYMLARRTGDARFLLDTVAGHSLYERLKLAYNSPTCDPKTGIVFTTAEKRAVGFIFCDSVYMTGSLLTASLLRIRASRQLAELARSSGKPQDADAFTRQAQLGIANIYPTFQRSDGWLKASTGVSSQADVWGTIYAIFLGVLEEEPKQAALASIAAALDNGSIEDSGALRHVPTTHDASATSAWEKTVTAHNRYQNGAFWHMPTGWLVSILEKDHPQRAAAIFQRYVTHMRENAFTMGAGHHAPWDCIGWNGEACQNPLFGPSITMPYGIWSNAFPSFQARQVTRRSSEPGQDPPATSTE